MKTITVMISGWAKQGDNGVNVSGVVQKPVTMPAPLNLEKRT